MFPRRYYQIALTIAVTLWLGLATFAQQAPPESAPANDAAATITFTRDWPKGEPPFYRIVVHSTGACEYSSQTSAAPTNTSTEASPSSAQASDSGDQAYAMSFTLSDSVKQQIFALARQANFFNGSFNYDHHKVADTGLKTLFYSDSARHNQTTYNWSENTAIDDLTHLFEGISLTLESGEQLRHLMRFDKLGLNAELAGMEQAASSGELREIQLIAPVLKEIASDSAYMHIAQQRARNLLALAAR